MSIVIRTIKAGKVRIGGQVFCVDEKFLKYDGRLDNQRFAFGCYKRVDNSLEPFVSLWGTEAEFNETEKEQTPCYCVDGMLPWIWWRRENGK